MSWYKGESERARKRSKDDLEASIDAALLIAQQPHEAVHDTIRDTIRPPHFATPHYKFLLPTTHGLRDHLPARCAQVRPGT
eukprot:SAG11_NODE_130_length_15497_cov_10.780556_14_plen_81_part_00